MENTIITFTRQNLEKIISNGYDYGWILNQNRAKACKYLVCCHSQGAKKGTAFLLGLISQIVFHNSDENGQDRWDINISEYASIDIPNIWGGWQNPVHYTNL